VWWQVLPWIRDPAHGPCFSDPDDRESTLAWDSSAHPLIVLESYDPRQMTCSRSGGSIIRQRVQQTEAVLWPRHQVLILHSPAMTTISGVEYHFGEVSMCTHTQ